MAVNLEAAAKLRKLLIARAFLMQKERQISDLLDGTVGKLTSSKMQRRNWRAPIDLRGLGHLLISIRIAQGISQRELAKRLGVHESQVSRDERNEYFGITLERAIKVLDALNVRLHTKVEIEPQREMAYA